MKTVRARTRTSYYTYITAFNKLWRWNSGGSDGFSSPRWDQARSVRTYSITFNITRVYVSLLFCHSLSFFSFLPLSSFFLFLSISPLFLHRSRVLSVCAFLSVSLCLRYLRRVCVNETKRGKSSARNIFEGNVHGAYRETRCVFVAQPVSASV